MIIIVAMKVGRDDRRHLRRLSLTIKDTTGELAAYELAATASTALCNTALSTKPKKITFLSDPKGGREYVIKIVMKFEAENSITNNEVCDFFESLEREINETDLGFKKTRP